jgi:hydrogenase nickel incorporation protein HypA/HybF
VTTVHEYSLVQSLMERIAQEAAARSAVAVHRVRLRIGELSGVEPELLESAFEIVREGTLCARAALEILRVPALWECSQCRRPIAAGEVLQCGACGAPARLAAGDDIVLDQLEMEVP